MKRIITIAILLCLMHGSGTKLFSQEVTTKSGLRYSILKAGTGEAVQKGQRVGVYESMGYLSGKLIYSLQFPERPAKFILGEKQAIDGVDEGVTGMKVGEIRKQIIPPSLSKRTVYPDNLSPDSTLVYKIELVEITKP